LALAKAKPVMMQWPFLWMTFGNSCGEKSQTNGGTTSLSPSSTTTSKQTTLLIIGLNILHGAIEMIKVNRFSGETYFETEQTKVASNGNTFSKMGESWVGSNGEVIQQMGDSLINTKTGVMSSWGDPFKDEE
jgi:hypothetical protein